MIKTIFFDAYDKQYLRDWLTYNKVNGEMQFDNVPDDIIDKMAATYRECLEKIVNYKTPVLIMFIIQILGTTFIIFTYRYLSYLWIQKKNLLDGMLTFFVAGFLCSFVDVMYWGGSLDYIQLFDWFTFDIKDCYLTFGLIYLILYTGIYYIKTYRKMSKAERKQTELWLWIKKVCLPCVERLID
ncbi:MAG: signal peptidase II [Eubacteriales bacterium]